MDAQQQANPPASCPTTWLKHNPANSPESVWLGSALTNIPDKVAQANLTNYMFTAGQLPPFLIVHGNNDCLVPWGQSAEMHWALTNRGAISELHIMPGWTHADSRFASTQTTPALDFLDLHLNARPAVSVRSDSGQLGISWPSSAAGYGLQRTSDLQASNTWNLVTNESVNSNGTSNFVLPLDSSRQFFRLAR
jgi:acetyl esterase/lipase